MALEPVEGSRRSDRPARSGAFSAFPAITRVGLIVLGLGVALVLAAHAAGGASNVSLADRGPALAGHLVTLLGMVLSVVGVLTVAIRQRSRPAEPREGRD